MISAKWNNHKITCLSHQYLHLCWNKSNVECQNRIDPKKLCNNSILCQLIIQVEHYWWKGISQYQEYIKFLATNQNFKIPWWQFNWLYFSLLINLCNYYIVKANKLFTIQISFCELHLTQRGEKQHISSCDYSQSFVFSDYSDKWKHWDS